MEITTKFNVGDTAYYLNESKHIVECRVKEIAISISRSDVLQHICKTLAYKVEYTDCELLTNSVTAGLLFATPEDLCKNLQENILKYENEYNLTN